MLAASTQLMTATYDLSLPRQADCPYFEPEGDGTAVIAIGIRVVKAQIERYVLSIRAQSSQQVDSYEPGERAHFPSILCFEIGQATDLCQLDWPSTSRKHRCSSM